MQLTWPKTTIILSIFALFGALAITGKLPPDAISVGVSSIIGWLGGWLTPSPADRLGGGAP